LQEGQYESSVPPVRDRIVQAAVKIVLEPVFETDFLPCSFGFRPGRSAHDALQVLIDESWRGRRQVVETDIANCFSAIPHDQLMQAIEERVCDRAVLALIRTLLRAGVMEGGSLRRSASGTPQGGLCAAEHNPPYEQCRVMRSAGPLALVTATLGFEHCA
jgi:RNA-directed DNA polymerase